MMTEDSTDTVRVAKGARKHFRRCPRCRKFKARGPWMCDDCNAKVVGSRGGTCTQSVDASQTSHHQTSQLGDKGVRADVELPKPDLPPPVALALALMYFKKAGPSSSGMRTEADKHGWTGGHACLTFLGYH